MQKRQLFLKLISVFVLISLLVCCLSPLMASAAFSGGSGTRNDPYLIKTANDLYNMRNNLSANYKLAATIDMKGFKTDSKYFNGGFVPIGDDSTMPFTGSFTCDLGSDGLPLYAILNLNVYNKKGEIYNHDWYGVADYPDALGQDPPYFYQTGLFGNTDGANISNIYVLNAEIYSSVVGQHLGRYADGTEGSLISYAAFLDTQATGILVGEAVNTTISHCAATGEVTGKSSRHGGLLDGSIDSNISDSYADVSIDTGGCWHIGNFLGAADGMTSITNCFSTGSLNASLDGYGKMGQFKQNSGSGAGGFVGSIVDPGVVIQNCWTNTKLSSKTKGNNFYGYTESGGKLEAMSNCFTYGEYEGKTSAPSGTANKNNCFASTATKGLQADFNAASPEQITKYFLTVNGWEKGDKYPVLSSTDVVTDDSIYVPGEEREKGTGSSGSSQSQGTTSGGTQSSAGTQSSSTGSTGKTQSTTGTQSSGGTQSTGNQGGSANTESTGNAGGSDTTTDNTASGDGNIGGTATDGETSTDGTDTNTSTDGATEGETTVETVAAEDEGLDTVQLVLVAILTVMIIGVSASTVFVIFNTLRVKQAQTIADDEDLEGDEQDE